MNHLTTSIVQSSVLGVTPTCYTPRNIQPTVPYGEGSVMVWGCISHDCKLDLVTIQGNLTGDQYVLNTMPNVFVDVVYQQWTFNDSP
jgi:hypothetical protein